MRVHVIISGSVQGVSFRFFVQTKAKSLGLTGWVKNTDSGHVEAEFEGDKQQIEKMLILCKEGSPSSTVANIDIKWKDDKHYNNFEIKY